MGITVKKDYDEDRQAPLYNRYDGELHPQDWVLEMDEDGVVRVDWNPEIGTAVPMDVWHGRTLRWYINPAISREGIERLLSDEDVLNLLERIHAGHEVELDNQMNRVGKLTEDALDANEDLERLLERRYQQSDVLAYVATPDEYFFGGLLPIARYWKEGSVEVAAEEAPWIADEEGMVIDEAEPGPNLVEYLLRYAFDVFDHCPELGPLTEDQLRSLVAYEQILPEEMTSYLEETPRVS